LIFLLIQRGHTLDLVCCIGITHFECRSRDPSICISDHKLVSFNAKLTVSKIVTFRNIKNIELSVFSDEVNNFKNTYSLNTDGLLSLEEWTAYYNDQLQNVLDKVAPVRYRTV